MSARYLVGIDLGTTNTVVAWADLTDASRKIDVFSVPQQVEPGQLEALPSLPSARFHASRGELGEAAAALGEGDVEGEPIEADVVVGAGALRLGARTPGRLITSAKSWLSHAGVDRHAPILPWGSTSDVPKASPVDVSASYLRRIRLAWDTAHPRHPLASQEVVVTVPASFDEAARTLTVEAAHRAGLPRLRLVEEPTAAFHHFLHRHGDRAEQVLAGVRLVLVVDVGGGTTDLTLVRVELRESGVRLTRIAVGDHLMLGGDNVDHALARLVEGRLGGAALGAARHLELVQRARTAKEALLSADAPDSAPVVVLGTGSRLVGGTLRAQLERAEVEQLVLDGFFPSVDAASRPTRRRSAIVEMGLPFAADPAISRHVVDFLARHAELAREALGLPEPADGEPAPLPVPDAVLLNGGVFHSPLLRARIVELLSSLRGAPVRLLEGDDPDRAVALGAVAQLLARRGLGTRIGGGSSRGFYLVVDETEGARRGVCLLPRGTEEGESIRLEGRTFALELGRPVRFPLASTTQDVKYVRANDVEALDDRFDDLPPLVAVLGDKGEKGTVEVQLVAGLTEVGTLELHCVERAGDADGRRFKLELSLRARGGDSTVAWVTRLHPRFAEAVAEVKRVYGKPSGDADHRDAKRVRHELEAILGPRDGWETPLLRELFGALLAGMKHRRRSEDHERVFFNLVGYTLRPGFGYPLDDYRVEQLGALLDQGVQFVAENQNWAEYWTMLRRVSGGLPPAVQQRLANELEPELEPPSARPKPRPKGPKKLAHDELVSLVGSLEHVEAPQKTRLGDHLVTRLLDHGENPSSWWAVGRLGARVPAYGSVHRVVAPDVAARWLDAALGVDAGRIPSVLFAVAQLARVSGDRARDLAPELRDRARARLEAQGSSEAWVRMVTEVTRLDAVEERKVFGDSLPRGLRLLDE